MITGPMNHLRQRDTEKKMIDLSTCCALQNVVGKTWQVLLDGMSRNCNKYLIDDDIITSCERSFGRLIIIHFYSAQSIRMGRPNRFLPFSVAAFSHASVFQKSTYPLIPSSSI